MAKPSPVRSVSAVTPMPEAARAFLAARLGDVQRNLSGLGDPPGNAHPKGTRASRPRQPSVPAEAVHDSRVATRRLRAALKLFGDGGRVRKADGVVSALQDALGGVRDIHVQVDAFAKLGARAQPSEQAALRHLRQSLASELSPRVSAMHTAVAKWEKGGLQTLARLERLKPPGKLGGHRTREALVGQLEKLEARVIRALEDPSPLPMHKLRIAVKRFRYALELLEPAMPEEVGQIYEALVPLQEALGQLHDTDVRIALVDSQSSPSTEGRDALLRRLRAERDRQAQAVQQTLGTWEDEAVALRALVLLSSSPVKRATARRASNRR
jgi:CHAD domain-containing protein